MADDLDAYIDGVMAALPVARKATPLSWWDGMAVWNRPLTDNEIADLMRFSPTQWQAWQEFKE